MPDSINRTHIEAAREAALNCWSTAVNSHLFMRMAWDNAKMGNAQFDRAAQESQVEEFHADGIRNMATLAGQYYEAEGVLSRDVLDYIAEANAPDNLPGIMIGETHYTTAHQAALYLLKHILVTVNSTVTRVHDQSGGTPFFESVNTWPWSQEQTEAVFRRLNGNRKILWLNGNRKILWETIVAAVERLPFPDFESPHIEREAAKALSYLARSVAGARLTH